MTSGDDYRRKAAELHSRATWETNSTLRVEFENLALAYLRLAAQAERNSKTDVVYEPPPDRPGEERQRPATPKKEE